MNFGIIFVIFVLQIVLALIVVIVLKRSLGKELTQVALERFEVLKYEKDIAQLKEIVVVSHTPLEASAEARIKAVAVKKFKGIPLNFATDSALKGGIRIIVGATVIDCSAKSRLDVLWGGK